MNAGRCRPEHPLDLLESSGRAGVGLDDPEGLFGRRRRPRRCRFDDGLGVGHPALQLVEARADAVESVVDLVETGVEPGEHPQLDPAQRPFQEVLHGP